MGCGWPWAGGGTGGLGWDSGEVEGSRSSRHGYPMRWHLMGDVKMEVNSEVGSLPGGYEGGRRVEKELTRVL